MKMTEVEELGRGFIEVEKKKKYFQKEGEVTSLKLRCQVKRCQWI